MRIRAAVEKGHKRKAGSERKAESPAGGEETDRGIVVIRISVGGVESVVHLQSSSPCGEETFIAGIDKELAVVGEGSEVVSDEIFVNLITAECVGQIHAVPPSEEREGKFVESDVHRLKLHRMAAVFEVEVTLSFLIDVDFVVFEVIGKPQGTGPGGLRLDVEPCEVSFSKADGEGGGEGNSCIKMPFCAEGERYFFLVVITDAEVELAYFLSACHERNRRIGERVGSVIIEEGSPQGAHHFFDSREA